MLASQSLQNILRKISGVFQKKSGVILKTSSSPKTLKLEKIFPIQGDLIVEFGVGKGLFIRNYAQHHPEKNFLGIEKYAKWTRHAARRIENLAVKNVKLMQANAEDILKAIPAKSVNEFFILFPDPWPKRRHYQRRLIQNPVIEGIYNALKENGTLYIATDHVEYYQWMKKIIAPFLGKTFESITNVKSEFSSNYQIKYEKEGRPIYFIHAKKIN